MECRQHLHSTPSVQSLKAFSISPDALEETAPDIGQWRSAEHKCWTIKSWKPTEPGQLRKADRPGRAVRTAEEHRQARKNSQDS
ncbi:hypothetical protein ACOMHN_027990 [Nucella lapillus]